MPARRRTSARPSGSAAATRKAAAAGREVAATIIRERKRALRRRATAIAAAPKRARASHLAIAPQFIKAAGAKGIATLVAEGDSWFDYLGRDVLDKLESDHGYDIESVARAGHRVEDMAYAGNQLNEFRKLLEKLLRNGDIPKAILLSGGGNDIAGEEFALLLNHASSPSPGLNDDIVRGLLEVRIRDAYVAILTAITDLCVSTTGQAIPVIVHGYDRPVPDGRGVAGGLWLLPGPWLRPGFHQKGFLNQERNKVVIGDLIDRFNKMLKGVAADTRFPHVRYLDLRGTLPNGANYDDWWANELHPTKQGFAAVADKFASAIARL